jgi:putative chitinase
MNKAEFFNLIRGQIFGGALNADQVKHIEAIVDASAAAGWSIPYAAYGLATAHHETARFVHLNELGGVGYFTRMYDVRGNRPSLARQNGNIHPGDGARFKGRGYVHLTWRNNYRRAGEKIGVDLENNPDRAAEPDIAARIMIEGMQAGWFTGRANRHYLDSSPPDYIGARRIINGTDKAALIAGYARDYERALRGAGYKPGKASPAPALVPAPTPPTPKPTPAPAVAGGFWSRFMQSLTRRLKG